MEKGSWIWFNGELVRWEEARVHVLTHALHYGTGVFEGMRCYRTDHGPAVFRAREHVERMFESAKIYLMALPYTEEDLLQAIKKTIRANGFEECYVRPIAFYSSGWMGVNPLQNRVDVAVAVWRWGAYLGEESLKKGVRCMVSSWARIDHRSLPSRAKCTANYANAALAKMEAAKHGFDEAIMLNTEGMVAEGSGENIFIGKDGALITPPVTSDILPGITRSTVIALARELGISCVERNLTRDELYVADEAFFTGTAAEITPIREVDGRPVGRSMPGPLTQTLQKRFSEIVRGRDEKFIRWLFFV